MRPSMACCARSCSSLWDARGGKCSPSERLVNGRSARTACCACGGGQRPRKKFTEERDNTKAWCKDKTVRCRRENYVLQIKDLTEMIEISRS